MPTRIESSLIIGPWQAVTPPCHWICRRPSASPIQSSRCHDCSSIFGQHYTKLQASDTLLASRLRLLAKVTVKFPATALRAAKRR